MKKQKKICPVGQDLRGHHLTKTITVFASNCLITVCLAKLYVCVYAHVCMPVYLHVYTCGCICMCACMYVCV